MTSTRNFKTVLKTIYPLNFQEFQAVLGGNKGNTSGKLYWLQPEKENTADAGIRCSCSWHIARCKTDAVVACTLQGAKQFTKGEGGSNRDCLVN